ncbi:hypothetical protein [Dolichospermum flos-aquae]|uniref:hypothetical protein n=1 Tax=Dolichospermum flosaquae TaxID=1166 RepID=UPI003899361E
MREYLGIKPYDKAAQKLIAIVVSSAAEVKDHPADLINITTHIPHPKLSQIKKALKVVHNN